jgi:VWFA-related protein
VVVSHPNQHSTARLTAFFLLLASPCICAQARTGVQEQKETVQQKDSIQSRPRLRVESSLVTLDVTVLTPSGYFVPELKKENFRVLDNGLPQTITAFGEISAPITAVLLVEHSAASEGLQSNALLACHRFLQVLQRDDWAALVAFDKRPQLAQDFTQDKSAVQEALRSLGIPLSREINLFDALTDTLDRLRQVEGRKYIILVATGQDTFSKKILDEVYKKVETAHGTVIYVVDTDPAHHNLQSDNQMRTFARMTGGQFYFATSLEEYSDVFADIAKSVRNRYTLAFRPSNRGGDGSWHKLKVEVINPDEKGHNRKYQVLAREGYRVGPQVK